MTIYDIVKKEDKNLLDFFESRYVLDLEESMEKSRDDMVSDAIDVLVKNIGTYDSPHLRFSSDVGQPVYSHVTRLVYVGERLTTYDFNIHKGNWPAVSKYFLSFYSNLFYRPFLYGDILLLIFIDETLTSLVDGRVTKINEFVFGSSVPTTCEGSFYKVLVHNDAGHLIVAREAN